MALSRVMTPSTTTAPSTLYTLHSTRRTHLPTYHLPLLPLPPDTYHRLSYDTGNRTTTVCLDHPPVHPLHRKSSHPQVQTAMLSQTSRRMPPSSNWLPLLINSCGSADPDSWFRWSRKFLHHFSPSRPLRDCGASLFSLVSLYLAYPYYYQGREWVFIVDSRTAVGEADLVWPLARWPSASRSDVPCIFP